MLLPLKCQTGITHFLRSRGSDIFAYDGNFKALQNFLPEVTDSNR